MANPEPVKLNFVSIAERRQARYKERHPTKEPTPPPKIDSPDGKPLTPDQEAVVDYILGITSSDSST